MNMQAEVVSFNFFPFADFVFYIGIYCNDILVVLPCSAYGTTTQKISCKTLALVHTRYRCMNIFSQMPGFCVFKKVSCLQKWWKTHSSCQVEIKLKSFCIRNGGRTPSLPQAIKYVVPARSDKIAFLQPGSHCTSIMYKFNMGCATREYVNLPYF